jgi:membrane fusion protein, multidrug efflux system
MMKKKIILALIGLVALVGTLAGIKALQIRTMIATGSEFKMPPTTVTTASVQSENWQTTRHSVGTLSAVQGVTVAAELDGKVTRIAFQSGADIRAGDLLVQQDVSTEKAQLPGAEAQVELARLNLERNRELLAKKYLSQAEFDAADAGYRQAVAEVAQIKAAIAKKTIRAPFAGKLGIRRINLGQMLSQGQEIVSLQALDPLFVEFLLPQQQLAEVRTGMSVQLTGDAIGAAVPGTINAINPDIDVATRNVRLQATLSNPDGQLRPGMYVNVELILPGDRQVKILPETAILYAPYGDSVFVVDKKPPETAGAQGQVLRQQFVRLGEKRGDFVAVLSGLEADEQIVSTGVFKLRNGIPVVVDNSKSPEFELAPKPENR